MGIKIVINISHTYNVGRLPLSKKANQEFKAKKGKGSYNRKKEKLIKD